jgi:hypothetical protein
VTLAAPSAVTAQGSLPATIRSFDGSPTRSQPSRKRSACGHRRELTVRREGLRASAHVRIATADDTRAIAAIHVASWQEGVAGNSPTATSGLCQLMLGKQDGPSLYVRALRRPL